MGATSQKTIWPWGWENCLLMCPVERQIEREQPSRLPIDYLRFLEIESNILSKRNKILTKILWLPWFPFSPPYHNKQHWFVHWISLHCTTTKHILKLNKNRYDVPTAASLDTALHRKNKLCLHSSLTKEWQKDNNTAKGWGRHQFNI